MGVRPDYHAVIFNVMQGVFMNFFFERSETDKEIIVVNKPYFLYLFFLALILLAAGDQFPEHTAIKSIAALTWFLALVVMVLRYFSMRKVWREMRAAMRSGEVTMSGSKLNPSNPLVVRIPKALTNKSNA